MPRNNQPLDTDIKERHELRSHTPPPRRSLELRGKRVSWAGIESGEPMQRGCDHGAWLERLADGGVRHVLMPLNGASEDACLFARRHISATDPTGKPRGEAALYDLEHRDEGFFTRLKFLLEAAKSAGTLIGLSLFDADPSAARGPLSPGGNVQNLALGTSKPSAADSERLAKLLEAAVGWICSAVRGSPGVYIELFRDAPGAPSALEVALSRKVAETFVKQGEDLSPQRPGPWITVRRGGILPQSLATQAAPFNVSRRLQLNAGEKSEPEFSDLLFRAETRAGIDGVEHLFSHAPRDITAMLRFGDDVLNASRNWWLWAALFRGYWPVAPLRVADKNKDGLQSALSAIARFGASWTKHSELRPCFDILEPLKNDRWSIHAPFAAQDGFGRFFVYFGEPAAQGLTLSLPSGLHRCQWVDSESGKVLDHCDGISGGPRANITGTLDDRAKLLIIEPSDTPEAVSSW